MDRGHAALLPWVTLIFEGHQRSRLAYWGTVELESGSGWLELGQWLAGIGTVAGWTRDDRRMAG